MEFTRPNGLGYPFYPLVFDSFKIKVEDSDEEEEFFIQDLTENFFEDALTIIVDNHAKGAVFHKAANTLSGENGLARVRDSYHNVFKEKISLVCLSGKTNEIVGVNALTHKTRLTLTEFKPSDNPNFDLLNESIAFMNTTANIFDTYSVDDVISAAGLCVIEKYRGRGIATKILQARALILKTIGVQVTTAVFSTVGAQKAASAAGYDENFVIKYENLNEKYPKLNFSHVAGKVCKIMSMKV